MSSQKTVLVVGAGWIGRQVGLRMAVCGLNVQFIDRAPAVLDSARNWMQSQSESYIQSILQETPTKTQQSAHSTSEDPRLAKDQPLMLDADFAAQWTDRVSFISSLEQCNQQIDVVLECVPEQIALKRRILREYSRQIPYPAIIASNSSYFTPSTLKQYVDTPKRFAHWHFHVPLHRSSIADVIGCEETEPWVIDTLVQLSDQIHQYPLRLRHEQPGYVFNWLLQSLLRSALELAAKDVVSIPDIDRAWKAVSGMPIGPFAMMDNIGLDVIEQVLANARWDESKATSIEQLLEVLRAPVSQGHLGIKTGRGFYDHSQQ